MSGSQDYFKRVYLAKAQDPMISVVRRAHFIAHGRITRIIKPAKGNLAHSNTLFDYQYGCGNYDRNSGNRGKHPIGILGMYVQFTRHCTHALMNKIYMNSGITSILGLNSLTSDALYPFEVSSFKYSMLLGNITKIEDYYSCYMAQHIIFPFGSLDNNGERLFGVCVPIGNNSNGNNGNNPCNAQWSLAAILTKEEMMNRFPQWRNMDVLPKKIPYRRYDRKNGIKCSRKNIVAKTIHNKIYGLQNYYAQFYFNNLNQSNSNNGKITKCIFMFNIMMKLKVSPNNFVTEMKKLIAEIIELNILLNSIATQVYIDGRNARFYYEPLLLFEICGIKGGLSMKYNKKNRTYEIQNFLNERMCKNNIRLNDPTFDFDYCKILIQKRQKKIAVKAVPKMVRELESNGIESLQFKEERQATDRRLSLQNSNVHTSVNFNFNKDDEKDNANIATQDTVLQDQLRPQLRSQSQSQTKNQNRGKGARSQSRKKQITRIVQKQVAVTAVTTLDEVKQKWQQMVALQYNCNAERELLDCFVVLIGICLLFCIENKGQLLNIHCNSKDSNKIEIGRIEALNNNGWSVAKRGELFCKSCIVMKNYAKSMVANMFGVNSVLMKILDDNINESDLPQMVNGMLNNCDDIENGEKIIYWLQKMQTDYLLALQKNNNHNINVHSNVNGNNKEDNNDTILTKKQTNGNNH